MASPVEKHFIDMLVEEELKGNMPQGQFKKGLWGFIQEKFNRRATKSYHKDQLRQKFQRLKVRHRVFSELNECLGMGWDSITKTMIGSEEVWVNATA